IRMQLSAPRYKAQVGRGNTLDTIDSPLIPRQWWKNQLAEIRRLAGEPERRRAIAALLDRDNPGPGGFYDDLGDPARRPHLVARAGYYTDPDYLLSPRIGFRPYPDGPSQWWRFAETHFDTPLEMRYTGLDPAARYKLRVVISGESSTPVNRVALRLVAGGKHEIHGYLEKKPPLGPLEFDIPTEATRGGELDLRWNSTPGAGGAGRGCQISEVWLIRVP
ncbi:MAG: hypothetical protein HYR60_03350, partial [Acidobacteria bacterium]|nr:hypothetical protein [Acidobacteriota bacterium]